MDKIVPKIYKSLEAGVSDEQFKREADGGVICQFSWETLKPFIAHAVNKRPGEKIVGIVATQDGLKVKFGRE